ncbi:MAG: tetratricopeptide repeat protein [Verrucomicrobia bacterium]|nr:tetratricopeptide repeat protein [Verrucomicrobiota bacterium]
MVSTDLFRFRAVIAGGLLFILGFISANGQESAQAAQVNTSGAREEGKNSPADDLTDESILELSKNLNLEHRRYLVYLYARLQKPKIATILADRILSETPSDKQTLLVLASMHNEQRNVDRALHYGRKLMEYFPGDQQARYYMGAAFYLAGEFEKARDILNDLKLERYKHRLYPYQSDLASATFLALDWHRAMQLYQELLSRHTLTDGVRSSVRRVLENIYRQHLPQVSAEFTAYLLDPGSYYRTKIDYRQHVTDASKLFVRLDRDDTEVKERPLLRQRWTERNDVSIGLETLFNERWTTSLSLGGSEAGLVGNAVASSILGEQQTLRIELLANQPSTDGLLFQSLDGRKNRAGLSLDYRIDKNWFFSNELYGWESVIEGDQLGLGYGATWSLDRVLIRNRPDLRLSYRGIWTRFSQTSENGMLTAPSAAPGATEFDRMTLLQSLLLPKFHRQGLHLNLRDQLSGTLSYAMSAGLDYAFDRSTIERNVSAKLIFSPTRRVELSSDLGFASSAKSADHASGS